MVFTAAASGIRRRTAGERRQRGHDSRLRPVAGEWRPVSAGSRQPPPSGVSLRAAGAGVSGVAAAASVRCPPPGS